MKWVTLLLLTGCVVWMPAQKSIVGQLVRVEHDDRYEAPCGIKARFAKACDEPPICCAYHISVRLANGKAERFWAFWPRYAPGLTGLVALGDTAAFLLHREPVYRLPCAGPYGCQYDLDYVLTGDSDVKR